MDTEKIKPNELIKSYFNKSRNRVLLRAKVANNLIDFQTGIKCNLAEFKRSRKIKIKIKEQTLLLAKCLTTISSADLVKSESR